MIDHIKEKIVKNEFEYTQHAVDQSLIRKISMTEFRQAVAKSEIIEDYPDDKYGPSCLLLGYAPNGRPIHFQCSYPSRPLIKIITLYEPDPKRWVDFKIRVPKDERL